MRARRAAYEGVTGTGSAYVVPTTRWRTGAPGGPADSCSPRRPSSSSAGPTLAHCGRVDHDVVRRAPLFAALDDQTAESLIALDDARAAGARRRPLQRGRPGRPALRHRRGQDQARPHEQRRPGEPARDPRPGRDVRRAVALRPGAAHGNRHGGRRDAGGVDGPRAAQGVPRTSGPEWLRPCSPRWPGGCVGRTRSLADLVFTDVPGRVAKALLDLAGRFGRPVDEGVIGRPRPHPGGARAARRRLPGDGQQGARRLRLPRMAAPGGPRRAPPRRRAPQARARALEEESSWARMDSRAAGHTLAGTSA